jgi:hypothetical protein
MSPLQLSQTKRRQISERDEASHSETQTITEMEELYWFAMALTGDPEFATRLVVDTGKLIPTGRGCIRGLTPQLDTGPAGRDPKPN